MPAALVVVKANKAIMATRHGSMQGKNYHCTAGMETDTQMRRMATRQHAASKEGRTDAFPMFSGSGACVLS